MLCPKCSKPVLDNARFCGSCGQAMSAAGAGPQATVLRPVAGTGGASAAAASGESAAWMGATSRFPGLFERIKNILLSPKTEWLAIEPEPTSIAALYTGYVIPLAALAALMSFVRMSVIGISIPFGGAFRTPILSGLMYALMTFGFGLLGLFLVGLIINALAPTFSGQRNQRQALKTAAYAFTPAWLGSVLALLPVFATLLQLAAGIYGIYVLYLGLSPLMRSPREKAFGYTAAVVICTILLGVVFGVVSALSGGFGGYGRFGGANTFGMTPEARQERAAEQVGNVIGAALGTDDKGKAGLAAAISNLAAAGNAQSNAATQSPAPSPAPSQSATANAATANAATASAAGDNPQNAVAATAGLLTALGGALGGSHRVDPVDFHSLKAMLPDSLPGMQRIGAEGSSQQALGVKGSSATASYRGAAGSHAEIKISDISGISGLLDAAGALVQNTSSESDSGYERDTVLGGRTAHEKYDSKSKHGELGVIVAKRFAVDVTGDGVDMGTLEQYASGIDFARLESMKNVNGEGH